MTEWQAIIWVLGGLFTLWGAYVSFKSWQEKRDAKIREVATQEAIENQSLKANWKVTEEIREQVIATNNLATKTTELVIELVSRRNDNISKEHLKYIACKELVKHHKGDTDYFDSLYKQFKELEKEEEQGKIKPLDIPDLRG